MILEGVLIGGLTYASYRTVCYEHCTNKKVKREADKKWRSLMLGLGSISKNDMCQRYELLEIFPKHYGFDAIVSIPNGKKFMDMVALIPSIEAGFKANVMMNTTEDKNTGYMRVHFMDREISTKDKLKFNWFKTFYNTEGCITKSGETVNIDSIEDIVDPVGNIVGYKVCSKIPVGLGYDKIKNSYDSITKTLGKCFLNFDYETMNLEVSIIHIPISNNTNFYPIKIKPWELYIAMGQDWGSIILDYSLNANSLIGGMQGSGKTNTIFSAFINLCNQCKGDSYEDSFELMVSNMGEKNDLRIFRDVKQCKYYANNETEVVAMLKYLNKEMSRRNKLFAKQKKFCFNIHQYNKLIKDKSKQLKVIHLIADEIADLMCNEEIQTLLWELIRKSRSSGIYITMATQRGSLKNLDSEIKGQFGNQICFSQPNIASALTIVNGEDTAKRVMSLEKKRECLVNYMEGIKVAKTLYLDERMMEDLLEDIVVDENKKIIIDNDGNLVTEESIKKAEEEKQKELEELQKNEDKKKPKKDARFTNFIKDKKGAKK